MIWKLYRQDAFGGTQKYYMEGNKGDLFALIGYMYSCLESGTRRIDYLRVPAIPMDECTQLTAQSEGYYKTYYLRKKEESACKK